LLSWKAKAEKRNSCGFADEQEENKDGYWSLSLSLSLSLTIL
jgi:hypothetical protein